MQEHHELLFNKEEVIVEKKKKKEHKYKAETADLRNFPFLLKDGDIIGVRMETENIYDDDF